MLKIKLARFGKKNQAHYRIVVNEARDRRDGKYVALLGHYSPTYQPKVLELDLKAYESWIAKGAQPTETVAALYKRVKSGKLFPEKKAKLSKKAQAKLKEAAEGKKEKKEEVEVAKAAEAPAEVVAETPAETPEVVETEASAAAETPAAAEAAQEAPEATAETTEKA